LLIADDLAIAGAVFLSSWRTLEGLPWIRGSNQIWTSCRPGAAMARKLCSYPSMQADLEINEDPAID